MLKKWQMSLEIGAADSEAQDEQESPTPNNILENPSFSSFSCAAKKGGLGFGRNENHGQFAISGQGQDLLPCHGQSSTGQRKKAE